MALERLIASDAAQVGSDVIPWSEGDDSPMFGSFTHQIRRRFNFVLNNRDIDVVNRLRIASTARPGCAAIRYLLDNHLIDGPGKPHFKIAGHRIHFQPDYPIHDRSRLLQGIGQALVETFLFPEVFSTRTNVREGDVVVDLGANIGATALMFSKLVGSAGKVYAFEPIVHELCRSNVERNHGENVTVVPMGVSDKAGLLEFNLTDFCLDSSLHSTTQQSGAASQRTAEVVRLDDWAEANRIDRVDFIKMDIEGAEENALRGARRLCERCRPRWSISSYHVDFQNELQHPKLVALLRNMGYSVKALGRQHIFAW